MTLTQRIRKTEFKTGSLCSLAVRKTFSFMFGEEQCISCGKPSFDIPLCRQCVELLKSEIVTQKEKLCSVCGKILLSEKEKCMACREAPVIKSADSVFPLLTYRLWKKKLLFSWKIEDKRALSSLFASLIYSQIERLFPDCKPAIVPVPPRPGKIRKKGWDQIDELCSFLEYTYGLKVLKMLERKTAFQQKKLDREQRLDLSRSSYALSHKYFKNKQNSIPEQVILIDDVLTTGVTVENCAVLLKKAGVLNVFAMTIFIVD